MRRTVVSAVAVAFIVIFPGVAFAQLAPQSQAEFEQRFTGWTLLVDAPDCNVGNVVDHGIFTGPGQFGAGVLRGAPTSTRGPVRTRGPSL